MNRRHPKRSIIEKIQWVGHVTRIPDNEPVKLVFAANPVGTVTRGAKRYCEVIMLNMYNLEFIVITKKNNSYNNQLKKSMGIFGQSLLTPDSGDSAAANKQHPPSYASCAY